MKDRIIQNLEIFKDGENRKAFFRNNWKGLVFAVIAVIGAIYAAKHFTKKKEEPNAKMKRPEVIDGGKKIKFVPGSIGLDRIKTAKIEKGSEFITVGAPARIIASITNSLAGGSRIVLFETPEINTLYSQYAHARNALTRASKNLKRLQDMYKNQVATEKDMIEVETEAGNSRAELAEHEGKLRALGFNPIELDRVKENVVWLISDVPEGDLNAVEKNKKVKIKFTSFPDLEMKGVAEAVGDTVDPLTRTVKVRISMPNPKQQFKPGMFAHVEFGDSVGSSFVIPFTAVFTVEGNAFAFKKIGDAEFEKVAVILGNSDRDKVEVMQGLSWNDEIVVSGTMLLKGLSIGY